MYAYTTHTWKLTAPVSELASFGTPTHERLGAPSLTFLRVYLCPFQTYALISSFHRSPSSPTSSSPASLSGSPLTPPGSPPTLSRPYAGAVLRPAAATAAAAVAALTRLRRAHRGDRSGAMGRQPRLPPRCCVATRPAPRAPYLHAPRGGWRAQGPCPLCQLPQIHIHVIRESLPPPAQSS